MSRNTQRQDGDLEFIDLDRSEEESAPEDGFNDGGYEEDSWQDGGYDDASCDDYGSSDHGDQEEDDWQDAPKSRRKKTKRSRIPWWIYLLIPAGAAAIVLVAVLRYQNWARGTAPVISQDNAEKYNVEVNDSMVLPSDSALAGHEDDGVTTILCLGDAPFSDETGDNGLAKQIESLSSNVTTINASFPNSQVACVNPSYDPSDLKGMDDIFNLFYVAYAIAIQDYTSLETVASAHPDDPQYEAAVEALKGMDINKVDMIAIMYDASDYQNGSAMYNPGLEDELSTYVGALKNAFSQISTNYPWIRIVFMSPTYMLYDQGYGNYVDSRTENAGNGTLYQYWQYAYDTCGSAGVSFLDNYYGSVNDSNYKEYLSDNIHLNDAGRTKIADHFVYKAINNEYAEYDVGTLNVKK